MNPQQPKISIALQGQFVPDLTPKILDTLLGLPYVDQIILSTYEDTVTSPIPERVEVVYNEYLANPGVTNRNSQITSSRAGIALVKSKYCAKMRTDQWFPAHSMDKLYNFWLQHEDPESKPCTDESMPYGRIFVRGLYLNFPYHPRDQVYWGFTRDIKIFFECPFDTNEDLSQDYRFRTRSEAWLGQFYFARWGDPEIAEHVKHPEIYTGDHAPRRDQALYKDREWSPRLFAAFPRVEMDWPKYGLFGWDYHHVCAIGGEYWAEG